MVKSWRLRRGGITPGDPGSEEIIGKNHPEGGRCNDPEEA